MNGGLRLRKLEPRADWQVALAITVVLRTVYSGIAAIAAVFVHPDARLIHSNALTENLPAPGGWHYALLGIWQRFDSLWYLRIAERGYDLPAGVVFYPLYPATIRAVSVAVPAIAAALLVATIAAFFCFWGLLRLARPELTIQGRMYALLLFAAWPCSFVMFAGYAESLTLALIFWAVIFARNGRWEAAALCGFLAGLSRPSGVLAFIPLAVLALRSRQARSLVVALAPPGLLSYWGWLRWSGRLSVVDTYRIYHGATLAPPWASVAEALRLILGHGDILLTIKLGLVVLAVGFSLRREVRLEDKLFALAIALQMLMYIGRPLLGALRYVLPIYPAFLMLGRYVTRRWRVKKLMFYLGCLGILNLAFLWAFLNWSLVF